MSDCLIVGAGIVGLSLAYELSQHGLGVQVVDQREVGHGASWAGAGALPPAGLVGAVHPLDQLRGLSHQLHAVWAERLQAETGIDTGYRRCGGINLAVTVGEAAALQGLAADYASKEITFQRLSAHELVALEPALAPLADSGRLQAAYFAPDECQLRNPRLLKALVEACRGRGVQISEHAPVRQWQIGPNRIQSVTCGETAIEAAAFCLTAGAWTRMLLEELHIANGLIPIRGQMVMLHCPAPPFRRILNHGSRYLVPRDDGRVLVGSTEEEVGFDEHTTETAVQGLLDGARHLVPALANAECERTWAGLRPGSLDGFPYLGRLPSLDNAFVAAGHFRSGLHLAPATAVVMSALIRGQTPPVDVTPFRIARG